MARAGRPPKLTPELADLIVSELEKGRTKRTAAALAGISRQTLYEWLRLGAEKLAKNQASKDPLAHFALRAERADALFQIGLQDQLVASATDKKNIDYRPIKHLLAVRFPDDFAHRTTAPASAGRDEAGEVVSPEEAVLAVADRLREYLLANPLAEPATPTPPETAGGG